MTRHVEEVERALEKPGGSSVVTLYGITGIGKSSLAQYVGLHYQDQQRNLAADFCFPDGVFYLFCGSGACNRVQQLQIDLLQNLGLGVSAQAPQLPQFPGEAQDHHDLSRNLRFYLVKQRLLIILDDVWEPEVIERFLTASPGVKYLVTSGRKDIWDSATRIELQKPDIDIARKIVASCTHSFGAAHGNLEFPPKLQGVVDEIIRDCEYHPLSLAHVAVSINGKGKRAEYVTAWREVQECLHCYLDSCDGRPQLFGSIYRNSVGASMMLAIESLQADSDALNLLYLLTLCDGPYVPEPVVKYFFSFLQPNIHKYNLSRDFLEGRSLLESRLRTGNVRVLGDEEQSQYWLSLHSLMQHYILEKKRAEVDSLICKLVCARFKLIPCIATMFGGNAVRAAMARPLLGDIDPIRYMRQESELVKSLAWLLDDFVQGGWKRKAHVSALEVIVDFVSEGRVNDENMALLVKLPEAAEESFLALAKILISTCGRHHEFCPSHQQTMESLVELSCDGNADLYRRKHAVDILELLARFEDLNQHCGPNSLARQL